MITLAKYNSRHEFITESRLDVLTPEMHNVHIQYTQY